VKVLVIGSGGREHALAWALRRSPRVAGLWVAPGNAGTATVGENVDLAATDVDGLLAFARDTGVDLTVVGPEAPLVAGIVDRFRAEGLACYGPTAAAARLEGSKAFAKEFMRRHGVPTASFATFDDAADARAFARSLAPPVVVKADGLAAGKGVVIAATHAEAERAIDDIMVARVFGDAGRRVVVEEFLAGEEVSVHAVCAGERALLLPTSQDHKRAHDGETGPNTGGMGAIAPVPWLAAADLDVVRRTIIQPVLAGLAHEGTPFTGTLYAGLMWTRTGPKVLEFNVRFGDPETEALVPLCARTDMATLLESAARGVVPDGIEVAPLAAASIVIAAKGYPERPEAGASIRGLEAIQGDDVVVFHAGTRRTDAGLVSAGGRVLVVTAWAQSLREAVARAYQVTARVHIEGSFHRSDIGRRHLAPST
jgi:phosphoribosylamine--glycine ligase